MFKNFISQPIYYGGQFLYNVFRTRGQYCEYNRVADEQIQDHKYMVVIDFSDKNVKNSKLLNPFIKPTVTLTLTKADGTQVQLTNGYTHSQKIVYDYFSTNVELDTSCIQLESNSNLYVEWILICPIDILQPLSSLPSSLLSSSSLPSSSLPYEGSKVQNNLYAVFDTVTSNDGSSSSDKKVVTKYNSNVIPETKVNYQYSINNRGQHMNPITKTAPWYEFTGYMYLDILRYILQFVIFLIINIVKYPFTSYNQVIYDGLPISYGTVANQEILFGKNFMYSWQVGKTSVVPYNGNNATYNKYLPTGNTYYICDLRSFKDVKVTSNRLFNSKLCWGTVILQHHNGGHLKPVLIDFDDNTIHLSPSLTSSLLKETKETTETKEVKVTSSEWLDAMKRLQDTHLFIFIYYHITLLHEFNEFLCVVFKRNFTPSHPLYHLYIPFTDTSIGGGVFDNMVTASSFPSFAPVTYQQISSVLYNNYTFDDMQYDKYLSNYGFTQSHIKQLPTTSRLLDFWQAISTYVDRYVDSVYNDVNGNDVTTDQTIINWFYDLRVYKGFSTELDTINIDTVKTVLKIHVFQVFSHWSDHNQVYDVLSEPNLSAGYNNGNRSNKLIKLYFNYIVYIANSSKYNGNIADFRNIMDISKFAVLDNNKLLTIHYDLLKSLLDIERQELQRNNYRDALLLNNVYQGTAY